MSISSSLAGFGSGVLALMAQIIQWWIPTHITEIKTALQISAVIPHILDLFFKLVIIPAPLFFRPADIPGLVLLFRPVLRHDRSHVGYCGKWEIRSSLYLGHSVSVVVLVIAVCTACRRHFTLSISWTEPLLFGATLYCMLLIHTLSHTSTSSVHLVGSDFETMVYFLSTGLLLTGLFSCQRCFVHWVYSLWSVIVPHCTSLSTWQHYQTFMQRVNVKAFNH